MKWVESKEKMYGPTWYSDCGQWCIQWVGGVVWRGKELDRPQFDVWQRSDAGWRYFALAKSFDDAEGKIDKDGIVV